MRKIDVCKLWFTCSYSEKLFWARISKRLGRPGIDSWRATTTLHKLAESIPGLNKRLQIRAPVAGHSNKDDVVGTSSSVFVIFMHQTEYL